MMKKKIGVLGGAFDPIHNGHIHMALSACDELGLDEAWLMPVGYSPNKDGANMASPADRLVMCHLATAADDRLSVSSLEMDLPEPSYTYRTLEQLKKTYPEYEFFFIMGGDSLDYFDTWVRPERIAELATIAVIPRDEFDAPSLKKKRAVLEKLFPCNIEILHCAMNPLSSTGVRESLRVGSPIPDAFPPGVMEYIQERGLYEYLKEN